MASGDDFEILAAGSWRPDQVEGLWEERATRRTNPRIEVEIANAWARSQDDASAAGATLYDGAVCRLLRFEASPDLLRVVFGPTSYRAFLGTNRNLAALRALVPEDELADHLASPVAVGAAILCADGALIVGRRSAMTATHSGFWHVPAGHPEARHVADGRVDLFAAMRDELREEVGIGPARLRSLRCLGVAMQAPLRKPEICFAAELDTPSAEIVDGPTGAEHDAFRAVPGDPEGLARFLVAEAPGIVPAAKACFTLFGREAHGEAWFVETLARLRAV